jgi:cytochrome c553
VTRIARIVRSHPWLAAAAAGGLAVAAVIAVVGSGIVPIAASSRHWPITEWFLHFAMRRSVVTHALKVQDPPPDLDAAAMAIRGAGHYDTGCRMCHGAPGEPLPIVPNAMTPHPPDLTPRLGEWTPAQLFYIVKHGVKFTGMPAWPAQQRDDEVWSMVAFLRRMPHLSASDYRMMVAAVPDGRSLARPGRPPAAAPAVVVDVCARCHGMDGTGRGGAFPRLDGQRTDYLLRAMRAYAAGGRYSGIMAPIARRVGGELSTIAAGYYAAMPRSSAVPASSSRGAIAAGARLASQGSPEQDVPPCASCHDAEPVNDAYPRLRGQYAWYLAQQLRLLQRRQRGGSAFVHLMHTFVNRLSDAQIEEVAAYYEASPPRVR